MAHKRIIRIDNCEHGIGEITELIYKHRCFKWCDGNSVDSFAPFESKSFKGYPYWLIVDEDHNLTWRNFDEIVDTTD